MVHPNHQTMISPTCIHPQRNNTSFHYLVPTTTITRLPLKLLMNVNIETCLGPVQVFISPQRTVNDLIKSALEIYAKERRRPLLKETNPNFFQLHYSPFSLESLGREEKLINLSSRSFFLCCNLKPVKDNQEPWEENGVSRPTPAPLAKLMDLIFLALGSCK